MSVRQDQLVLAIETTAPNSGAALARASGAAVSILAEQYAAGGGGRAESLGGCVRAVFETSGCPMSELTGIAVVDGPGSYTALRVGLALARGIALVDALELAPVGSLELIARMCAGPQRLCTLLDAGQEKVYAAGFVRDGANLREVHAATVIPVAELRAELAAWGGDWAVCGDAELARAIALDVMAPPMRAAELARVGVQRFAEHRAEKAEAVLPRYVGAVGARPNRAAEPAAVLVR